MRILVIAALACTGTVAVPAQNTETNAAVIRVGVVRGFPGETVSVPIAITHTGAVSAVQFDMNYQTARMTASLLQSALPPEGIVIRSRPVAPGRYRFLVYSTGVSALSTNVGIGELPFSLPAGDLSGGGQLRITNELAAARGGSAVEPVRLLHGAILVGPVFRGPDGVVDVFLTVDTGRFYVMQATTDFANWVNLSTNYASVSYIIHKDLEAAAYPMRFYRAVPVATPDGESIESLALNAGGFITFDYPTIPGREYVLQASTNLVDWSNMDTNVAAAFSQTFTNLVDPAYAERFFRVAEQP
jgi:hypothetical protein